MQLKPEVPQILLQCRW